jgi:geranylgeranyl diphosphate synthase type II
MTASFTVASFLHAERERVETALRRVVDAALDGAPAAVAEPVRYALDAGGKRLRPILCAAAYRAARVGVETPPAVYDLAAALELVHTYSLVHDDLPGMDDDDVRRGRPATHRAFDTPRAMVAGAALIPLACGVVARAAAALGLDAGRQADLVAELAVAAGGGGMVGGQVADLEAEGRTITLDELETIHRRKTGALLTAALRLGGMAAGAGSEVLRALDRYGRALGLAFQITDDLLDVTGRPEVTGKTAGRDADLAKATFPGLLGVEEARRRAGKELENALAALAGAGISSQELVALAAYAVERDR